MKNLFYRFSRRWIFILSLFEIAHEGRALDCFKCVSIGGDNKACDDPFHNNGSLEFLESPCLGGRKNRDGLFPATACVKIAGIYDESGKSLTIRSCALDSGTLTTDSELIRMSHCGGFYFDNKYVRGCVQSCSDADACNVSSQNSFFVSVMSHECVHFYDESDSLSCMALEENNEFRSENSSNSDNKFSIVSASILDFLDYIYSLFTRVGNETFQLVFQAEDLNDVGDLCAGLIFTITWLVLFSLNNSDWFNEVVCFFRDLCIEAMQTFANVFQGIVNVIGSITCDDVEDFASACIVVLLWIGAAKIVFNIFNNKAPSVPIAPLDITIPMIKTEENAPRRGARRRGMPRRRGRRRINSPC